MPRVCQWAPTGSVDAAGAAAHPCVGVDADDGRLSAAGAGEQVVDGGDAGSSVGDHERLAVLAGVGERAWRPGVAGALPVVGEAHAGRVVPTGVDQPTSDNTHYVRLP